LGAIDELGAAAGGVLRMGLCVVFSPAGLKCLGSVLQLDERVKEVAGEHWTLWAGRDGCGSVEWGVHSGGMVCLLHVKNPGR
jgi:hypothetical protein